MERFWSKVAKGDRCWLWKAGTSHGYGSFRVDGKVRRAHVVSWKLEHGSYPELYVCHSCDTPLCVRPDHLFLGTQVDNMRDCVIKGRIDRKFPIDKIGLLVSLRELGYLQRELADMFGLTQGHVSQLLRSCNVT